VVKLDQLQPFGIGTPAALSEKAYSTVPHLAVLQEKIVKM